jgi:TPP-dependent pyruvate/acetoin dehydrogenase alpha subunit
VASKKKASGNTGASTGASKGASAVNLPNDDIGEEERMKMWKLQLEVRHVEQRAQDLFFENLIKGTTHLSVGQEAIAAGFGAAMEPDDYTFCTYRGHAHTLVRGASMVGLLGELMGRECGMLGGKGGSMHLTSVEHGVMGSYAIIGAHLPLAVGAAWSAQYRGTDQVTVCFFGDGTTNIGAFHEALNMAQVWKLPVVFVCENNLYMEYTPISEVTATEHPAADRASAYGLPSIIVDGNDADAVFRIAQEAFAKARAGDGPSLIEAKTYRHYGHSRADPGKYRPDEEVKAWMDRDPIPFYRQRLVDFGVADSDLQAIEDAVLSEVDAAVETCKASPPPSKDVLFTDVWADGGSAWRN